MKNTCKIYTIVAFLPLFLAACVELGLDSAEPIRPDRLVLLQKYGAAMREVIPSAGTTTRLSRSWSVQGSDYDNAFQAWKYGLEGTAINRLLGYGGTSSLQMNLDIFDAVVTMINSNVRYENGIYRLADGAPGSLSLRSSVLLDQFGLGTLTGTYVELDLTGILHTFTYGTIGTQVILSNQHILFEQQGNGEQILIFYVEPFIPTDPVPMALLLYGRKTPEYIDFRIANWSSDAGKKADYLMLSQAISSNIGTYQVRSRMEQQMHFDAVDPGETNTFLLQGNRILFSIRGRMLHEDDVMDECYNVNPVNFAKLFPDGDDGSVTNTTVWSGSNALTNITMPLVHDMDANQLPHNPIITDIPSLRWW